MQSIAIQSRISWVISWGSLIVTLLVTDRISSEPVNVGKMVALATIGFLVFGLGLGKVKAIFTEYKMMTILLIIFLAFVILSAVLSENTIERGFYGTVGRNTGALTYASLILIFLAILQIRNKVFLARPIKFFYLAAFLNVIYCLFAAAGTDLFRWTNPYNLVLGTFGNPNFIGAFMGINVSLLLVAISSSEISNRLKSVAAITLLPSIFVLWKADALQGALLVAIGLFFIVYFFCKQMNVSRKWRGLFGIFSGGIFLISFLGVFGFGPFAGFLNKPSIQFRGEYWFAGIQMGINNLFTGVGIDSYGTYYRTFRGAGSVISPGVDVTTDAAHNVYLDILAGTGLFGFGAYVAINAFVLIAAMRFIKDSHKISFQFKFYFVGWSLYQTQSLFSINQIGLAVWGWVFAGSLLAYIKLSQETTVSTIKEKVNTGKKTLSEASLIPPQVLLSAIVFGVVGLLISLPPFLRDMEMRKATVSKSVSEVFEVSKRWPTDSSRMNRSIIALANSGNLEMASDLVTIVNSKYPNDYLGWYTSLQIEKARGGDVERQLTMLRTIDPLNPAYFKK